MVEQNICLITYFLTFVNLLQEILGENNKKGLKKGKQRLALVVKLRVMWARFSLKCQAILIYYAVLLCTSPAMFLH